MEVAIRDDGLAQELVIERKLVLHVEHALARFYDDDGKRISPGFLVGGGVNDPHLELVSMPGRSCVTWKVSWRVCSSSLNAVAASPAFRPLRHSSTDTALPATPLPATKIWMSLCQPTTARGGKIRAGDRNALLTGLGRKRLFEFEGVHRHVVGCGLRLRESAGIQAVGQQKNRGQRLPLEAVDELANAVQDIRGAGVKIGGRFIGRQLRLVDVEDAEVEILERRLRCG